METNYKFNIGQLVKIRADRGIPNDQIGAVGRVIHREDFNGFISQYTVKFDKQIESLCGGFSHTIFEEEDLERYVGN